MSTTVLDREVYTEAHAARLLRIPQNTLHYWLEGEGGSKGPHEPIIREHRKGARAAVTWAEFIEAGLLREYRAKQVQMSTLRRFIVNLRNEFQVPYPLAHHRPWIDTGKGRDLLYAAQVESDLDPEFALVTSFNGQYILTAPSQSFLDRVTWIDDVATAYRPHDDPSSAVRCSPTLRFGLPAVRGISTAAIAEQHDAGLDVDELAEQFSISEDEVYSALAFERSVGHAA